MRWFTLPAVAALALAFAAPTPAKAQVIVGYPSSSGGYGSYYGGIQPIGEGGLLQLGLRLALAASNDNGWNGYGYPAYYGGYYPSYYGGYAPGYSGNWGGYGYRNYSYPVYQNWGGYYGNRGMWNGWRGIRWRR